MREDLVASRTVQIDAVLESDAEEYVRSFVQKGGQ